MAPFYAIGWLFRPFWRFFLQRLIAWDDKIRRKKLAQGEAWKQSTNLRVWLQFELRRPWLEVVPELDQVEQTRERLSVARAFSLLYFWNGRLKEARQAADYWAQAPENWARQHPEEARRALELRSSQWTWYPRQQLRPNDVPGPNDPSQEPNNEKDVQQFVDVLKAAEALDNGLMIRWCNARLAIEMLNWITAQIESGALHWPLQAKRKEKRPLLPIGAGYDYDFAQRIGMTDETFDQMWHNAMKLDA